MVYTIDKDVREEALKELEAKGWSRKDAEIQFSHSWHSAISLNQHSPIPPLVEVPVFIPLPRAEPEMEAYIRKRLAKTNQIFEEGRMHAFETIKQGHREGMITLFTMNRGINRATAEKIVDNHILSHRP